MHQAIAYLAVAVVCFGLGIGFSKRFLAEAGSAEQHLEADAAKLAQGVQKKL